MVFFDFGSIVEEDASLRDTEAPTGLGNLIEI